MDAVENILIALRRMIRAVDLHSRTLAREHGLTVPQLVLLKEIHKAEGLTVGDLARRSSISQATVTSILSRLLGRDLVRATSATDRRRKELRLTQAGHAMLEQTPPLLSEEFAARFLQIERWEQHMILGSLERLADLMDARELDAAPVLTTETLGLVEEAPDMRNR